MAYMNIKILFSLLVAVGLGGASSTRAAEETVGEKTAEAWDATKKTTKAVTKTVVKKTKEAANAVEDAIVNPDADARKVNVTVTDKGVQMPGNIAAGKTAFVVKNSGKKSHNFEVEGAGLKKSFWLDLAPGATKTMQVDLKPGTYEADCRIGEHAGKEAKVRLTVK